MEQDRVLFVPPPEQIGQVRTASTTLRAGKAWQEALARVGVPFRHTVGYVGEAGVACFECTRSRANLVRREVLAFSDAVNLFAHSTPQSFEFLWKDPLDRLLFRYEDAPPAAPGPDHILHLLLAAEQAWTANRLRKAIPHIERGGTLEFPVLGQGAIRLDTHTISWGNQYWERADLDSFSLQPVRLEVAMSYRGQGHGKQPLVVNPASVANVGVLRYMLEHALHLTSSDTAKR